MEERKFRCFKVIVGVMTFVFVLVVASPDAITIQEVVFVTNLNDSGPGSLRAAVSAGNRYVAFAVDGTINLRSPVEIKDPEIIINGAFSPSGGITLKNHGIRIAGEEAHDIVLYSLRIRAIENDGGDGISVRTGAHDVYILNLSINDAWDEAIGISRGAYNVVVANSILANSDVRNGGKGSLIFGGAYHVFYYRNLFYNNQQRNPKASHDVTLQTTVPTMTADIRNNVMIGFSALGTQVNDGAKANVINNYYDAAGTTSARDTLQVTSGGQAYASGNVSADGVAVDTQGNVSSAFLEGDSFITPSAEDALQIVLAEAGVRPLDATDQAILRAVESGL